MRWYTVIGLIDAASRELTVAGVVLGEAVCVDIDPEGEGSGQRWAMSFHADPPAEAERMAHDEVEWGDTGGGDRSVDP